MGPSLIVLRNKNKIHCTGGQTWDRVSPVHINQMIPLHLFIPRVCLDGRGAMLVASREGSRTRKPVDIAGRDQGLENGLAHLKE